jgi:hypothetical protein
MAAGCEVSAAMETNSVLSLMLAVTEGGLHSVLPGARWRRCPSRTDLGASSVRPRCRQPSLS